MTLLTDFDRCCARRRLVHRIGKAFAFATLLPSVLVAFSAPYAAPTLTF
jgi:hypothetical protein